MDEKLKTMAQQIRIDVTKEIVEKIDGKFQQTLRTILNEERKLLHEEIGDKIQNQIGDIVQNNSAIVKTAAEQKKLLATIKGSLGKIRKDLTAQKTAMDTLATDAITRDNNWDEAATADNVTIAQISKTVKDTIDSLAELQKANNRYHTSFIQQNLSNLFYADSLGDNRRMIIHALEFRDHLHSQKNVLMRLWLIIFTPPLPYETTFFYLTYLGQLLTKTTQTK